MNRSELAHLIVKLHPDIQNSKGTTRGEADRLKIARRILRLLFKIVPKEGFPDEAVVYVVRRLAEGVPAHLLDEAGIVLKPTAEECPGEFIERNIRELNA